LKMGEVDVRSTNAKQHKQGPMHPQR
jgi:hypothetical protein